MTSQKKQNQFLDSNRLQNSKEAQLEFSFTLFAGLLRSYH